MATIESISSLHPNSPAAINIRESVASKGSSAIISLKDMSFHNRMDSPFFFVKLASKSGQIAIAINRTQTKQQLQRSGNSGRRRTAHKIKMDNIAHMQNLWLLKFTDQEKTNFNLLSIAG